MSETILSVYGVRGPFYAARTEEPAGPGWACDHPDCTETAEVGAGGWAWLGGDTHACPAHAVECSCCTALLMQQSARPGDEYSICDECLARVRPDLITTSRES